MAYRTDRDIEFLGNIKSENLADLVYVLTHDTDGSKRWTEEITESGYYRQYGTDYHEYWHLIAAEIQAFGANTFATMFRGGQGVPYREVATDVCDKLKVNYNKASSIEMIENNLLMKILSDALDNMSQKELNELAESIGMKQRSLITPEALMGTFQAVFRAGGFKSYQLTLIVVNGVMKALLGRGLSFAGNAALTRTMSILTGPIGWAVTGIWTAVDIAGPAYRVTIPAVIQIAVLRQKYLYEEAAKDVEIA